MATEVSDVVSDAVRHAAELLPAQGPISIFIHHNTLHAFQERPFHDAIREATRRLDVHGYLSAAAFREHLRAGRITEPDLDRARARLALASPVGEMLVPDTTLIDLLLRHDIERESAAGLSFRVSERDALRAFRPDVSPTARDRVRAGRADPLALDSLWRECTAVPLPRPPTASSDRPILPRDVLRREGAGDPAELVHPVLVRMAAAFLDTGLATEPWPDRELGFLASWRRLHESRGVALPWKASLSARLQADAGLDARGVVVRCLDAMGVREDERPAAIEASLLALPGWAGMFHRLEQFPADRGAGAPPVSLLDFLAVRLTYDVLAADWLAREHLGLRGPLRELRARPLPPGPPETLEDHEGAWPLFQLCQLAGVSSATLASLDATARARTLARMNELEDHALLRIFQEAYEDHYYGEILGGLAAVRVAREAAPAARPRPPAQIVCCIDEREESFRRAIEDVDPRVETFGAAGFFGLPIAYRSVDSDHARALCPVALTPVSAVSEEAAPGEASSLAARTRRRGLWGRIEDGLGRATRSLSRSIAGALGLDWVAVPALGLSAAVPFTLEVLAPHTTRRLARGIETSLLPAPRTRLGVAPGGEIDGLRIGFPLEERVSRIAATLRGMGLASGLARVVVVLGHGSSSRNNPHESAHDCGACGGAHGGPNGRLFAEMANDPEVRAGLRAAGLSLDDDVVFVGGQHDTASDAVTLFDLDRVPPSHAGDLTAVQRVLDSARRFAAHERCRRFESAPLDLDPERALQHVEARSSDLAQVRPEFGHCTNAVCIVGRRALSRGLFLDRRSFLVSYDPTIDPSGAILERTLAAVGPVGAGISLEYYFSFVDQTRLGCGTKLPHNLTGLLGVMDGASSDLRTGLPVQMTEIHEPMRLLLICEATPETLLGICARQAEVAELVVGGWVRVVSVDPESGAMQLFEGGRFVPYDPPARELTRVQRSIDWYRGRRGFLPPALITRPLEAAVRAEGADA